LRIRKALFFILEHQVSHDAPSGLPPGRIGKQVIAFRNCSVRFFQVHDWRKRRASFQIMIQVLLACEALLHADKNYWRIYATIADESLDARPIN